MLLWWAQTTCFALTKGLFPRAEYADHSMLQPQSRDNLLQGTILRTHNGNPMAPLN